MAMTYRTTRVCILALGLAAVVAGGPAAGQNPQPGDRIARVESGLLTAAVAKGQPAMTIADRMKHYRVPGASVAVINNGVVEWARGYGVTDAGGGTRVTADTLFQAASISKPVAVMGMLALVEQGTLKLDDDINLALKSWKLPDNDFTKDNRVTLRRLSSHSAGTTVHGFRGYAAGEPVPTTVQVLDGVKPANSVAVRVDLAPGSQWRYSGGGITVMQLLMADVTGKSFPALMSELVLSKIGMTHSTYEQPLPAARVAHAAAGHLATGAAIAGKWHTHPEMAAAGLWTTAGDLAAFAVELQRAHAGKSQRVLSQAMAGQMLTKQSGDYGLGIGLGGAGQAATFSHGGSNVGFKCILFAYVHTGQGAVVMTNGDRGNALASEILRSISREYGWPDHKAIEVVTVTVDPEILKTYAGTFQVSGQITIAVENGKLVVQTPTGERAEAFALSETEFQLSIQNIRITFIRNSQGAIDEVTVASPTGTARGKRVK